MKNNKPTILAINPGTRYIGIAVLKGTDLVDWGTKVLEGKWSPAKLEKAVTAVSVFIDDYQPVMLAIKSPHLSRSSDQLDELCSRLVSLARNRGLATSSYSIQEIESFVGQGRKTNRARLAELVSLRYPALMRSLKRERSATQLYHTRMFVAVGLALTALGRRSSVDE